MIGARTTKSRICAGCGKHLRPFVGRYIIIVDLEVMEAPALWVCNEECYDLYSLTGGMADLKDSLCGEDA
jgi:hypothetical protein